MTRTVLVTGATRGVGRGIADAFALRGDRLVLVARSTDASPNKVGLPGTLESVATELAVMLVLRTRRPFFRSRPGSALLGSSIAVAGVTVALPFSPLAEPLGLVPPPISMLLALLAITAGYVLATELAKARFYRRTAPLSGASVAPVAPGSNPD